MKNGNLTYWIILLQGYTPLHIAMQFGHENIFNLLVQVYGESFYNKPSFSCHKMKQFCWKYSSFSFDLIITLLIKIK